MADLRYESFTNMESEPMGAHPGLFEVKEHVLIHGGKRFYPEALGRGNFMRGYIGTGEEKEGPYVFSKDDLKKINRVEKKTYATLR